MLPAVPLLSSRAANQGRTTFQKPAPRNSFTAVIGSSRFEPNWRTFAYANSGRFPVCAGPALVGIKRWLSPRHRQSWTGWPARCRDGLARLHIATASGFFLLDIPAGFPKGISSAHHGFVETRKGVPTNWAGTPRCALCRPLRAFCQVSISRYQVSFRVTKCLFAKLPTKSVRALPHQWEAPVPKRLGISTLTPGPIVEEIATRLM